MPQVVIQNGYAIWTDKQTYPQRYSRFYNLILEGLKGRESRSIKVADVGCSRGYATLELKRFLEEHGYAVTTIGIDFDRNVLGKAYVAGRIDHPIQGLSQDLPINHKSIDVVVCGSVIEYFPPEYYSEAMQEFGRILKDDGVLMVNNPYPDIVKVKQK